MLIKFKKACLFIVLVVFVLSIFMLSSCKDKKTEYTEYDEKVITEVNQVYDKIDDAKNAAERKELFNDAEKIYQKVSASQGTYSDDDKAFALAFYKYTNQKEVEDMDEETFRSLGAEISYEDALKLVAVYKKEFEELLKKQK